MARPIGWTPGSFAIAPGFTGRGIDMNGGQGAGVGQGRMNAYGQRAGVGQGRINAPPTGGMMPDGGQGRINAPLRGQAFDRCVLLAIPHHGQHALQGDKSKQQDTDSNLGPP